MVVAWVAVQGRDLDVSVLDKCRADILQYTDIFGVVARDGEGGADGQIHNSDPKIDP